MKKFTQRLLSVVMLLTCTLGGAQLWAQTSPLFSEDFEGGSMPTGWTQDQVSGTASWTVAAGDYSSSTGAGEGTENARITANNRTAKTKLITPEIDLSSVASAELSFMHIQRSWSGDIDELRVYYRASSSDEWTLIPGCEYTSTVASWTTKEEIALPNLSNTYQIAFEFKSNYGYGVGLDNVVIVPGASCPKPSGLEAALTIGDGSIATLNWIAGGSEDAWVLEYGTTSDFTGAISVNVTGGTPSKAISGLTPETKHYARVKADCGGGDESDWSATCEFTPSDAYIITLNDKNTTTNSYIPIYGTYVDYGFRSQFILPASALVDLQWASIQKLTLYATQTSTAFTNDAFNVYLKEVAGETFASSSTFEDWEGMSTVYSGAVAINNNMMEITFANSFTYQGGNLLIGFQQTAYNTTVSCTWVGVAQEGNTALYQYANSSHSWTGTVTSQKFIPKVTIYFTPGTPPSCLPPTGLNATEDQAHQSELSWTANNGEASWDIYYKKAADAEYTKIDDVTTNPYTLQGLDAATNYLFYVVANCSEDSDPSAVKGFLTACDVVTIPAEGWSENFDALTAGNNVLPLCWSYINATTYSSYQGYPKVYNYYANSASNCLYLYSYYSSFSNYDPQPQYAILPEMSNLDGKRIKLYARGNNATSTFKIGRMTDPTDASTFVAIKEQTFTSEDYDSYQEFVYNLTGTGNYIAIMIDAASSDRTSNGVYIDDIRIEEIPSCTEPSGLEFVSATTNTATLQWTAGGSESAWDVYYSTENVAPTAATEPLASVTTNPGTIPGLTPATTYYVWVRAHCSDADQSPWVGGISFATECDVISVSSQKYTENFDAYSGSTSTSTPSGYPDNQLPLCWEFLNRSTASSEYPMAFISSASGYPVSGNCLFLKSSSSTPLYAILPAFTENISDLMLTFTYRNEGTGTSNGTLIVGYMTNPADAATFSEVLTCTRTTSLTEKEVFFDGAPAGSYIAFNYQGGSNNYYLSIDNVSVEPAPSCRKPADLTWDSSVKSSHKATLSWTAEGSETAWQIAYSTVSSFAPTDDFTPGENEGLVNVTTNPATIDLPTQSEDYYAYVRANCGTDGYSAWCSKMVSFNTISGNTDPSGLQYNEASLTSNSVSVSWTGAAGNDLHQSFELYMSTDNTAPTSETDATITGITEIPYTITGLTAETQYYVWVRDNCGTDGYSAWSAAVTFTTLANCQIPEGISASNETAHTADIAWTIGASNSYNLRYRIAEGSEIVSSEGFEDESEFAKWQAFGVVTTNTASGFGRYSYAKKTGDYGFAFSSYSTATDYNQYLISPELTVIGSKVKFFYRSSNTSSSGEKFRVAFSSTGNQVEDFDWDNATIYSTKSTSWDTFEDDIPAGTKYIGINYCVTSSEYRLYIDDFTIENSIPAGAWQDGGSSNEKAKQLTGLAPETKYEVQVQAGCESDWDADRESAFFTTIEACFAPTLNAASKISATKATLSWTAGASEEAWQICVNGDEDNLINVTENSYVLDGLTAETEYSVKIRSNCGGEGVSVWSNQIDFTTEEACPMPIGVNVEVGTISANVEWTGSVDVPSYDVKYRTAEGYDFNFFEGFEGGTMPEGWSKTGSYWKVGSGTGYSYDNSGSATDDYNAACYINSGNSTSDMLITPTMDLSSMENVTLSFNYLNRAWSGDINQFRVYYRVDGGEWQQLYENLAEQASWTTTPISIVLQGLAANYQIGFKCTTGSGSSAYGYGMGIDDVTIIGGELHAAGDWQATTSDEASKLLSGLVPGVKYDVTVKSGCADDIAASWSDTISFTTSVNSVTISDALYATHINEYPYVMPEGVIGQAFGSDRQVHQAYASGDVVAAGVPLVLHGDADTYTLLYSADAPNATPSDNLLIGVLDEANKHVADEDNYWFYVLSLDENSTLGSVGFYWYNDDGSGDFDVPVHKCYLKLPANPLTSAPSYVFNENNTTSLDNLYGVDGALKFYYEGHFYILRDGIIYDATGRKVDNLK